MYFLQCFEVLEALGLPCIQAPGEAEAYCAWLNGSGVSVLLHIHDRISL